MSSSSASGNIYGRKLLPVLPPCVGAVEQFNAAIEEVSGDEQQRLELLIQQAPEQHETLQPGIMIDINLSVLVCIKP